MAKRAYLLMGLAIIAVVATHAPESLGTSPSQPGGGGFFYYIELVYRQLIVFSVPAFLAASGFFMAYAASGTGVSTWAMVKARIVNLLIPYLIWSVVILVGDALSGHVYPAVSYVVRLCTGADHTYYYVPLLLQFYLLAPFVLVSMAKSRPRWLLIGSGLIQLAMLALRYTQAFYAPASDLILRSRILTWSLCLHWAFYFPLGMVCGLWPDRVKSWVLQHKTRLQIATVTLAVLAIIEPELIYRATGDDLRFGPMALSSALYSVCFILCFLVFSEVPPRWSKVLTQAGRKSYGIYLLHSQTMSALGSALALVWPPLPSLQYLLLVLLFACGLGIPLLFMDLVARTPARHAYRYLFG